MDIDLNTKKFSRDFEMSMCPINKVMIDSYYFLNARFFAKNILTNILQKL